jgi:hypothetical protein
MKNLVVLGLFLGVTANACPNLTGKFACSEGGEAYTLEITQAEANGITTYTGTVDGQSSDVVADGIEHSNTDKDDNGVYFESETITCSQSALVDTFTQRYTDNKGVVQDEVNGVETISINADNNLAFETNATYKSGEKEHQASTCTRQ